MNVHVIGRVPSVSVLLVCAAALSGCASTYEANGDMDVAQARATVQRLLPGHIAGIDGKYELIRAITEVRVRPDGIGLLWTQARDLGFWSGVAWDNPKTLKICYFAQSMKPTVTERMGTGYVLGLCDIGIQYDNVAEARRVADALYVLEQNAR